MDFRVGPGHIEEAYQVAVNIPEFTSPHYSLEEYQNRLNTGSLVLLAYHNGKPVGFKAGYARGPEGHFYSWMGGILPQFRRQGLALELARKQEEWAGSQGYTLIWFKTSNRNRAMISFAINHGFQIREVIPKGGIQDYRIIMQKEI